MPALGIIDPKDRLRRILETSLDGCVYDASETEQNGGALVIHAHRSDGKPVSVRFLGLQSSDANAEPQAGELLSLRIVDVSGPGCLSLFAAFSFLPFTRPTAGSRPVANSARVRIDVGGVRLDIVCQDAEWWEDAGPR